MPCPANSLVVYQQPGETVGDMSVSVSHGVNALLDGFQKTNEEKGSDRIELVKTDYVLHVIQYM